MAKYTIDSSTLTDIADAIRTQYDDDSPINPLDMAEAILGIEGGGGGEYSVYIEEGTAELISDNRNLVVNHSLPIKPILAYVTKPSNFVTGTNNVLGGAVFEYGTNMACVTWYNVSSIQGVIDRTQSDDSIEFYSSTSTRVWKAGYEYPYKLIAIKKNEE